MSEFLKFSRNLSPNRETMVESHGNSRSPAAAAAKRLDILEKKVEENGKKLDRICQILETMNHFQQ
jgi:hypothetical protein